MTDKNSRCSGVFAANKRATKIVDELGEGWWRFLHSRVPNRGRERRVALLALLKALFETRF
jgi:hypothetical protein